MSRCLSAHGRPSGGVFAMFFVVVVQMQVFISLSEVPAVCGRLRCCASSRVVLK